MNWSRAHFLIEQHPDNIGQFGIQSVGDAVLPIGLGDPFVILLTGLFLGFGLEMGRRLCLELVFYCGCCLHSRKETEHYNDIWKDRQKRH